MIADRLASFQAAHDVAGHLIAVLAPLPTDLMVRVGLWAPDEPLVRAYAHMDLAALLAWQSALGGRLTVEQFSSGNMHWKLAAAVDSIPVEAWTILDPPSDAEVALCGRWMDEHGDDPAEWSPEIRAAYATTVASMHASGAL